MVFNIPLSVYQYLLRLGVVLTVIGSLYYYNLPTTNRIMKVSTAWFMMAMVFNLINMDVTLGHFQKNTNKIGPNGEVGKVGPKGFKGNSFTCGSICGSTSREYEGDNVDENGNLNPSEHIKIGKCVFPFVYKYTSQYEPIKACKGDESFEESLRCFDVQPNGRPVDETIPVNANETGVCATKIDIIKKTPIKWAYTQNSEKLKKLRKINKKLSNSEAEFQKTNTGITDIEIVTGAKSNVECPVGYKKISKDLNEASSGAYVYACKKEGTSSIGVGHIGIAKNAESCGDLSSFSEEDKAKIVKFKKLPVDLNKDADVGGYKPTKLYMCLGYTSKDFITDIQFKNESDFQNVDFKMLNTDLNEGTDGNPIYLYYSKTRLDFTTLNTAFLFKNQLFFFIRDKFYSLSRKGKMSAPIDIKNKFGDLPENIDGAFVSNRDDKLYFFSGNLVYQYNQNKMRLSEGYPKKIDNVFNGIPSNIDAVFVNQNDGNTYFFKDRFVYKFNISTNKIEEGYPRVIKTKFPGAPDNPDAVFYSSIDNKTYFLRGNRYWILKPNESVEDGYPKPIMDKFPGLGVVPESMTYFTASDSFSNSHYFFYGGNGRKYFYKLDKKKIKLGPGQLISDTFKKAPDQFDCIYYNDVNRNYYMFGGMYVYIYKGSAYSMTHIRKAIGVIYPDAPDNIDCAFKVPGDRTVYLLKGITLFKYTLNDDDTKFSFVETIDLEKELPKLFDTKKSLDAIVFVGKTGGKNTFSAIQGIKTAKFTIDNDSFNMKDQFLDYLDSKQSPFYSVDKKQGLKVRQNPV